MLYNVLQDVGGPLFKLIMLAYFAVNLISGEKSNQVVYSSVWRTEKRNGITISSKFFLIKLRYFVFVIVEILITEIFRSFNKLYTSLKMLCHLNI